MKQLNWHYDMLDQWNEEYYKGVMLPVHLTGEEISIGKKDEDQYFYYVAKKGKQTYLVPSEIVDKGEIPFRILAEEKYGHKGKAYLMVLNYKDIKIRAEQTLTYKQMINSWMDYEHEEKDRYTLWKIIVDCAYSSRINLRVITHPGWLKDSPVFSLSRLRGNCSSVNKPTIAKLKYLLNDSTRILGLNEVQKLEDQQKQDLEKFYEDIGDFKTVYTNPTRSTHGTQEECNINNLSSLTFSNFPDSKLDYAEQKKEVFDFVFHPKIRSRVFPVLFRGGTETQPACKQRFGHVVNRITPDEIAEITNWLRNHLYYEINGKAIALGRMYKNNYSIENTRWDRNFQAICERIKLYAESQEEFDKFTKLLYECHQDYLRYVQSIKNETGFDMNPKESETQQTIIEEEFVEDKPDGKCEFCQAPAEQYTISGKKVCKDCAKIVK